MCTIHGHTAGDDPDQAVVWEENFFQMQYADLLNRLCNFGFIPAKKVTEKIFRCYFSPHR